MARQLKATRGVVLDDISGYPRLGEFRKGGAKQDFAPGSELSYFRVTFKTDSDLFKADHAAALFRELYGAEPRRVGNVQLLSDNPALAFTATNERWGKSKDGKLPMCVQRCDGEAIYEEFSGGKLDRREQPCRFPACGGVDSKQRPISCQLNARLVFCLPEFSRALGVLGYFLLTSHSRTDFKNISGMIRRAASFAPLTEIPFMLSRVQDSTRTPDGLMVSKWFVRLDLMPAAAGQLLPTGSDPDEQPLLLPRNDAETDEGEAADQWQPLRDQLKVVEHGGKRWYQFQTAADGQVWQTDDFSVVEAVLNDYEAYPDRGEKYILPGGDYRGVAGEALGKTRRLVAIDVRA